MPEIPNRSLAGVAYHEIDSWKVTEYCTTGDGTGAATEVHLLVLVKGAPYPLIMRFPAPGPLDAMIEALTKYRAIVWPPRT